MLCGWRSINETQRPSAGRTPSTTSVGRSVRLLLYGSATGSLVKSQIESTEMHPR